MIKKQWKFLLAVLKLNVLFILMMPAAYAQTASTVSVGLSLGAMGFHPTAWWGYPPGTYIPPHPHSGYYPDASAHPAWAAHQSSWPAWEWLTPPAGESFKPGQWQCIAFDHNLQPYVAVGVSLRQAANLAHAYCGQADYTESGCYIPRGYCRSVSADIQSHDLVPE